MTLKVQIFQTLRRLFLILVGLMMTWFSEKMLIFNICRHGLMPNLIKQYWLVSNFTPIAAKNSALFCTYLLGLSRSSRWRCIHGVLHFYQKSGSKKMKRCLSIYHSLKNKKKYINTSFLALEIKMDNGAIFTRCGHVVRDFESKAKTRCNFQFR